VLGKAVAALIMLIGYSMIVVLAGVISQEFSSVKNIENVLACNSCNTCNHDIDARYCKYCGKRL